MKNLVFKSKYAVAFETIIGRSLKEGASRSSSRLRLLNCFRPDNQSKPCTCKGSF